MTKNNKASKGKWVWAVGKVPRQGMWSYGRKVGMVGQERGQEIGHSRRHVGGSGARIEGPTDRDLGDHKALYFQVVLDLVYNYYPSITKETTKQNTNQPPLTHLIK